MAKVNFTLFFIAVQKRIDFKNKIVVNFEIALKNAFRPGQLFSSLTLSVEKSFCIV